MQYIIMLTVVLGLAVADFLTGIIKGYATRRQIRTTDLPSSTLNSTKMRKGGLNKIGEIIVMATACGLEIGIRELGRYYSAKELAGITGAITAIAVFIYIALMEVISILENYAEINSQATWVARILKRLKSVGEKEEKDDEKRN